MEREILLVANSDGDSNAIVKAVAEDSGRRLRKVSSTRQTFDVLATDLENVDVVIIDLDPGMHALAILEAIGGHEVAPPVIALTSLEESEVTPIASRHGAIICLGKPFQHSTLAKAIERCLAQPRSVSCDLWGHPRKHRRARVCQPARTAMISLAFLVHRAIQGRPKPPRHRRRPVSQRSRVGTC